MKPFYIDAETGKPGYRSPSGSYGFISWLRLGDVLKGNWNEVKSNKKVLAYKIDEDGIHFIIGKQS